MVKNLEMNKHYVPNFALYFFVIITYLIGSKVFGYKHENKNKMFGKNENKVMRQK